MKISGFIYARSDSSRLPNKVMSKVGSFNLIELVAKRSKKNTRTLRVISCYNR